MFKDVKIGLDLNIYDVFSDAGASLSVVDVFVLGPDR